MLDVVLMPDPTAETLTYLGKVFDANPELGAPPFMAGQLPSGYTKGRALTVTDLGGAGVYERVLSRTRLAIDAYADDSVECSDLARLVYGVMKAWPQTAPHVMRVSGSHPIFNPDHRAAMRAVYTMYLDVVWRGESLALSEGT